MTEPNRKSSASFNIQLTFWHIAILYLICSLAGFINIMVGITAFICNTAMLVTIILLAWKMADKEADKEDGNRTISRDLSKTDQTTE